MLPFSRQANPGPARLCGGPAGLRCQARSETAWAGGRGTIGAFGGRVYYEATVADEGLCR